MVYVEGDGSVQQSRPISLGLIPDLLWGSISFVNLFFRSLFHMDDGAESRGANGNAPRTPGRGGMGGARRMGRVAPPPPPCAGGSCRFG